MRKAFVFDMDGTILDNMAFHAQDWIAALAELRMDEVDPIDWERRTSGVTNREIFTGAGPGKRCLHP